MSCFQQGRDAFAGEGEILGSEPLRQPALGRVEPMQRSRALPGCDKSRHRRLACLDGDVDPVRMLTPLRMLHGLLPVVPRLSRRRLIGPNRG
ncbi:hypothetical protein BOS5A_230126 [Bosea sp. EC-HK365B]|nr:hypothetical protein BOSE21B_90202 [Bosea sp. 21B]VVT60848.1 hypothetical protein BOS5A_230126 [Bosea sp. EC-HK365B]